MAEEEDDQDQDKPESLCMNVLLKYLEELRARSYP